MEFKTTEGEKYSNRRNSNAESKNPKVDVKDASETVPGSLGKNMSDYTSQWKRGESINQGTHVGDTDTPGEVNMEASISADDVMRAGGFGARDDISSFLPVASDSTDFEATILDARDYEEPQGEAHRPGLGWTDSTEGTKKE